ncbi:hypothetical protein PISMIDRAFT_681220 [Pisolithus microcarpus 441]|uniref:Uncharacterized protein n=1 Tax=Pisolithus microcarpus 441 TaxID=765257 RepID=A0A0C9ZGD9_9AGAM|nr:hypothetical protein PISMIDRAFT_681220 [Pisolithus microcarpus 441]
MERGLEKPSAFPRLYIPLAHDWVVTRHESPSDTHTTSRQYSQAEVATSIPTQVTAFWLVRIGRRYLILAIVEKRKKILPQVSRSSVVACWCGCGVHDERSTML